MADPAVYSARVTEFPPRVGALTEMAALVRLDELILHLGE